MDTDPLANRHALDILIEPLLGSVPKLSTVFKKNYYNAQTIRTALLLQASRGIYRNSHRQHIFFEHHHFDLIKMRQEKGLSQDYVAKHLNIRQGKLSCWERGIYMPSPRDLSRLINTLGVRHMDAADWLLKDMRCGLFHYTPAHLAYLLTGDIKHPYFIEIQWALTVYEWRWQFGVPMTLRAARIMSGAGQTSMSSVRGLSQSTIYKLEHDAYPHITSQILLALAVAYTASPLSLLNGLLMKYSASGCKKFIGGGMTKHFRTSEFQFEGESYNEDEFTAMKDLCVKLGLVPDGQVQLFELLTLTELSGETDLEQGLVEYRPFPLSPEGLRGYRNDEQTAGLADMVSAPTGFGTCLHNPLGASEILDKDEAYQMFKVEPYHGLGDTWREDLAKLYGVGEITQ